MKRLLIGLLALTILSCQQPENKNAENVITSDIDNFWTAYDLIIQETDTARQITILDSFYIKKGSAGLEKIIEVRNYQASEYIQLINNYPKYWNSLRENTFKSKQFSKELNSGINNLGKIYPYLKPAKIYFTIVAMRTNGTTRDSLVLIGSELAMADSTVDISEFEGRTHDWLANFFGSNPIDGIVLLNVHEYIHTQQNPIPDNLLHIVLYEGIAEFVSVTAMGVPSDAPAIEYGKGNPAVREKFEKEMFYERTYDWLWSNSPNEFDTRDLGYYIGYAIAEIHYNKATDKLAAIKEISEDNGIYTSGGAYSFLNMIVYLIEKYYGRETAIWCSKMGEIEFDRISQNQFIIFSGQMEHADEEIKNVQEYIEENFAEKFSVETLAKKFAISHRNFIRRFKKATRNTPFEYIQRVKIEIAKKSLEASPKNITEVMYDVGYNDDKAFRKVFKKYTGLSPIEYQRKFNREMAHA